MTPISDISRLDALYRKPGAPSLRKVVHRLTPRYRAWIMASKFCVLSTVGPEGTDASPRGDEGPCVMALDDCTLAMPDWRGNNRLDSLRNIVRDPRVSLMFFVPGSNNVIRVNGRGFVTDDQDLRARFAKQTDTREHLPATVIVIEIGEIYSQCARALMRSGLWGDTPAPDLPSAGDLLAEASAGEEGGQDYDAKWHARAAMTMWSDP